MKKIYLIIGFVLGLQGLASAQFACGDAFIDSGGTEGEYASDETETYVFCPTTPGQVAQLVFSSFELENQYDFLTIHNGSDANAPVIGSYTGLDSPGTIIAENTSGCLTVVFVSDDIINAPGWEAVFNCTNPPSCLSPSMFTNTATTDISTTLSWVSDASTWRIEYGPAGFTPGTGTFITTSSNPFNLTGLTAMTSYNVYIRSICSATDSSAVTGPLSFQTTLPPFICGNLFTDAGGLNGEYENNINDTIVICPSIAGQIVELNFTSFETELGYDHMTIYDGDTDAGTLIGTYQGTQSPGHVFATNPMGCLTIVFHSDGTVTRAGWVANINCVVPPTCTRPTNLELNSASDVSAIVSWTNGGTETQWMVEYGPAGFVQGTGTQTLTSNNPYTITGLAELTNYDVYVRAFCSVGDTSAVTGPLSFQTTMTPLPPFICGNLFTDAGGANGNYLNDTNDTIVICPSGANQAVQLVFSTFELEPIESDGTIYDSLMIYDNNNPTGTLIGSFAGTNSPGTVLATNATGCLTVVFASDFIINATGWTAAINCISTVVCDAPTNLGSSASSATTATLTWTNGGTETAWSIEYGQVGFTPGNGTIVSATTNPFTLTGLTAGTNYEYYVKALCSDVDFSLYAGPATFSTHTISVDDLNANSLSIQPNPTKGIVVIKNLTNVSLTGELFDAQGRSLNINSTINANSEISIDINNFENGIYFFKTISELGNKTFSIVKN